MTSKIDPKKFNWISWKLTILRNSLWNTEINKLIYSLWWKYNRKDFPVSASLVCLPVCPALGTVEQGLLEDLLGLNRSIFVFICWISCSRVVLSWWMRILRSIVFYSAGSRPLFANFLIPGDVKNSIVLKYVIVEWLSFANALEATSKMICSLQNWSMPYHAND